MACSRPLLATMVSGWLMLGADTGIAKDAEATKEAEFWQWYSRYVNEDGEIFDPLDLADVDALDDETTAVESRSDSRPKAHAKQQDPSAQARPAKDSP